MLLKYVFICMTHNKNEYFCSLSISSCVSPIYYKCEEIIHPYVKQYGHLEKKHVMNYNGVNNGTKYLKTYIQFIAYVGN